MCRLLLVALVSLSLIHAHASSRSSSRRHDSYPRRRRRKKRRVVPRPTDPHDVSSSSPSILPMVFSDDEREESILSALARLELEDDEDDDEEEQPKFTERKRESSPAPKAKPSGAQKEREQREETDKREVLNTETPSMAQMNGARETMASPTKETVVSPSVPPTVASFETIRRSQPRPNLSHPPLERPQYSVARQAWTRPPPLQRQQQSMKPPPSTERRAASVPGTTSGRPAAYPYPAPNGTVRQTRPSTKPQSTSADSSTTTRWVRNFLASRPKDTLLPVPREYLSDGFNLVQLAPIVERIGRMENGYVPPPSTQHHESSYPLFKAALRLILQRDNEEPASSPPVQRAAEVLYTLVHARYVISPRGLDTIRRVLRRSDGTVDPVFGRCPRIKCRGMPLLPYGDSDNYDARNSVTTRAKRYCPCCTEVFYMWDSKADESSWGPSFCHLFLMIYGSTVFPDLHTSRAGRNGTDATIFGFRLHPAAQLRYEPV